MQYSDFLYPLEEYKNISKNEKTTYTYTSFFLHDKPVHVVYGWALIIISDRRKRNPMN